MDTRVESFPFVVKLLREWVSSHVGIHTRGLADIDQIKELENETDKRKVSEFRDNALASFEKLLKNTAKSSLVSQQGRRESLTMDDLKNSEPFGLHEIHTLLLLRSDLIFSQDVNYGKRYIGPLVWELLYHVLIQNKQNINDPLEYMEMTFDAFDVCTCGLSASYFLAQIKVHFGYKDVLEEKSDDILQDANESKVNTNAKLIDKESLKTLLYVMHEQSKLSTDSTWTSFRNFDVGRPMWFVFSPRKGFADPTRIRDNIYLRYHLLHNLFGLSEKYETFVQNELSVNTVTTKEEILKRIANDSLLLSTLSPFDYVTPMVREFGISNKLAFLLLVYATYVIRFLKDVHTFNFKMAIRTFSFLFDKLIPNNSVEMVAKNKWLQNNDMEYASFLRISPLLNICTVMATGCKFSMYDIYVWVDKNNVTSPSTLTTVKTSENHTTTLPKVSTSATLKNTSKTSQVFSAERNVVPRDQNASLKRIQSDYILLDSNETKKKIPNK
jgi:hypothetical protein